MRTNATPGWINKSVHTFHAHSEISTTLENIRMPCHVLISLVSSMCPTSPKKPMSQNFHEEKKIHGTKRPLTTSGGANL